MDSLEFYQVFWDLIKDDMMALFMDFHHGSLPWNNLSELSTSYPKRRM